MKKLLIALSLFLVAAFAAQALDDLNDVPPEKATKVKYDIAGRNRIPAIDGYNLSGGEYYNPYLKRIFRYDGTFTDSASKTQIRFLDGGDCVMMCPNKTKFAGRYKVSGRDVSIEFSKQPSMELRIINGAILYDSAKDMFFSREETEKSPDTE